jgi:hypothetical protein
MPYLYCEKDGREHERSSVEQKAVYRQADESVLIVKGRLISGPWRCDKCNAHLKQGDSATLVSAFPSHCRDQLYDYDFGYERQYFAMKPSDTATVYGSEWPDDSIRDRSTIDDV